MSNETNLSPRELNDNLEEAIKAAKESLRLLSKLRWPCDYAHHEEHERHELNVCPVEKAIAIHILVLESITNR